MGFLGETSGHVDGLGAAGGVVVGEALPLELRELPADLAASDLVTQPQLGQPCRGRIFDRRTDSLDIVEGRASGKPECDSLPLDAKH